MISFDEASLLVDQLARPLGAESVALAQARGRVLAEPVLAGLASPRRAVSAMDGYAVRDADLHCLPIGLAVAAKSYAGSPDPGDLPSGSCMRVFTGAPVPRGADRVIVQEVVEDHGDRAVFASEPPAETHIRPAGSDFPLGAQLLEAGSVLGPRQLVAAAAADRDSLRCIRRPIITLLATGDELVAPGGARSREGSTPDSLSCGLEALIAEWGGISTVSLRLPDDLEATERAAAEGVERSDLVVVTGGASVGEKDLARAMFGRMDLALLFAKVAMKPGKPVWLGRCRETAVIGLPGNPTSAMVTARLLLAPLVAGLAGQAPGVARLWQSYQLSAPLPATGDRESFFRGRRDDKDRARPVTNQESHAQHALAQADLLIRRPRDAGSLPAGERVDAITF